MKGKRICTRWYIMWRFRQNNPINCSRTQTRGAELESPALKEHPLLQCGGPGALKGLPTPKECWETNPQFVILLLVFPEVKSLRRWNKTKQNCELNPKFEGCVFREGYYLKVSAYSAPQPGALVGPAATWGTWAWDACTSPGPCKPVTAVPGQQRSLRTRYNDLNIIF